MGERTLATATTVYLVFALLLAIPMGHQAVGWKFQGGATLGFAFVSSALWLVGAVWPLFTADDEDESRYPPGLTNGAAAVFALVAAASSIPFPA